MWRGRRLAAGRELPPGLGPAPQIILAAREEEEKGECVLGAGKSGRPTDGRRDDFLRPPPRPPLQRRKQGEGHCWPGGTRHETQRPCPGPSRPLYGHHL